MKPSIFNLYHLSNHLARNLKLSNAGGSKGVFPLAATTIQEKK